MNETSSPQSGAFLAKLGAWLQAISLLVAGLGVAQASKAVNAAEDPDQVTEAMIGLETLALAAQILSLGGLVMITAALIFHAYRAAWIFYFLGFYGLLIVCLSICLLLFTPFSSNLHLAFGVFFVGFATLKKADFQRAAKAAHKLPSCYQLDP